MKHFNLGKQDLARIAKAISEQELDRIIGDRFSLPSPHHDRINLAHARLCALVAQCGPITSKNLLWEMLDQAGVAGQDMLDALEAYDIYDRHPLATEGRLKVVLDELGLPSSKEHRRQARPVAIAAIAHACLAATQETHPNKSIQLGVPTPTAFQLICPAVPPATQTAPTSAAPVVSTVDSGPNSSAAWLDGPISHAAEAVITTRLREKLWDQGRAKEVRASVALFIHANGDILVSTVGQLHLAATVRLMSELPTRYNHFMVEGQGGFAAALASVAATSEETEGAKVELEARVGLHSGTRNKHLTWLKAIFEGAAAAGYPKAALDFAALRHSAKHTKKTDKRKKHEKRPNWTLETFRRLTSGPVYEGCAGIDRRFHPGTTVLHDGVYWAVLIVLNICGRPSEGAGLTIDDVFENAPIPYFHIRPNSLRRLKTDEGERKVPIHPKLIDLGFLDYARAIRAAGHVALFPEWVHPEGKLDFAWMMRDKAIDPAKAYHFPNGTGLELYGKAPDGHSLRGTGRSVLADGLPAVEEKMRNYIAGHTSGRIGVDVYETPPPLEDVLRALEKLDPWFEDLTPRPLNMRPADRMRFGGKRGRPRARP